jgi:hypothetical protein
MVNLVNVSGLATQFAMELTNYDRKKRVPSLIARSRSRSRSRSQGIGESGDLSASRFGSREYASKVLRFEGARRHIGSTLKDADGMD